MLVLFILGTRTSLRQWGVGCLTTQLPGNHPEHHSNTKTTLETAWKHPGTRLLQHGGDHKCENVLTITPQLIPENQECIPTGNTRAWWERWGWTDKPGHQQVKNERGMSGHRWGVMRPTAGVLRHNSWGVKKQGRTSSTLSKRRRAPTLPVANRQVDHRDTGVYTNNIRHLNTQQLGRNKRPLTERKTHTNRNSRHRWGLIQLSSNKGEDGRETSCNYPDEQVEKNNGRSNRKQVWEVEAGRMKRHFMHVIGKHRYSDY